MTKQKHHPLIFVAFLLAAFLLVNPAEFDLAHAALRAGLPVDALVTFVVALAIVVTPLVYAQRQMRLHPEKYRPRLLTKITWAMIGLNITCNVAMFTGYLTRVQ